MKHGVEDDKLNDWKMIIYLNREDAIRYRETDKFCHYFTVFGQCTLLSCDLEHTATIEDRIFGNPKRGVAQNFRLAKVYIEYLEYIHSEHLKIRCFLHALKGDYNMRLGFYSEAERLYKLSLDKDKFNPPAAIYRRYGEFVRWYKRDENGMAYLKQASNMKESPHNDYLYGLYLMQEHKHEEAYYVLKYPLRHNPDHWKYLHVNSQNLHLWIKVSPNDDHFLDLIFVLRHATSIMYGQNYHKTECEKMIDEIGRWKFRFLEDLVMSKPAKNGEAKEKDGEAINSKNESLRSIIEKGPNKFVYKPRRSQLPDNIKDYYGSRDNRHGTGGSLPMVKYFGRGRGRGRGRGVHLNNRRLGTRGGNVHSNKQIANYDLSVMKYDHGRGGGNVHSNNRPFGTRGRGRGNVHSPKQIGGGRGGGGGRGAGRGGGNVHSNKQITNYDLSVMKYDRARGGGRGGGNVHSNTLSRGNSGKMNSNGQTIKYDGNMNHGGRGGGNVHSNFDSSGGGDGKMNHGSSNMNSNSQIIKYRPRNTSDSDSDSKSRDGNMNVSNNNDRHRHHRDTDRDSDGGRARDIDSHSRHHHRDSDSDRHSRHHHRDRDSDSHSRHHHRDSDSDRHSRHHRRDSDRHSRHHHRHSDSDSDRHGGRDSDGHSRHHHRKSHYGSRKSGGRDHRDRGTERDSDDSGSHHHRKSAGRDHRDRGTERDSDSDSDSHSDSDHGTLKMNSNFQIVKYRHGGRDGDRDRRDDDSDRDGDDSTAKSFDKWWHTGVNLTGKVKKDAYRQIEKKGWKSLQFLKLFKRKMLKKDIGLSDEVHLTCIMQDIENWVNQNGKWNKFLSKNGWYDEYFQFMVNQGINTFNDLYGVVQSSDDLIHLLKKGNVSARTARKDGNQMFNKLPRTKRLHK